MKTNPPARSKPSEPELELTYEHLAQLNHHCLGALERIQMLGDNRLIPNTESKYYGAVLQELRASVSQIILEQLSERELSAASAASRARVKIEKRMFK